MVDAQVHIWDASPHNQAIPDGEVYALDLLRRHRELDGCRRAPARGGAGHRAQPEPRRVRRRARRPGGAAAGGARRPVRARLLARWSGTPRWPAGCRGGSCCPASWTRTAASRARAGSPRGCAGSGCAGSRCASGADRPGGCRWPIRGCAARWPGAGRPARTWCTSGSGPSTRPAPWRRQDEEPTGAPRGRPPRVPRWAEPVRAGSALPARAGAAARVAPPGFDVRQFRELAAALPEIRFVLGAGCLPTEQLCALARLPNVHVMLTEILPWTGSTGLRARVRRAAGRVRAGAAAVRQRLPDDAARPAGCRAGRLPVPGRARGTATRASTPPPSGPCSAETPPGSTGSRQSARLARTAPAPERLVPHLGPRRTPRGACAGVDVVADQPHPLDPRRRRVRRVHRWPSCA